MTERANASDGQHRNPRDTAVARAAFAALCLAVAALYTASIIREGWENLTSHPVAAQVSFIGVDTHRGRRGDLSYRPVIELAYTLHGRKYESARYDVAGVFMRRAAADRIVAQYRVGQRVMAYVREVDPSAAFLRRQVEWSRFVVLALLGMSWLVVDRSVYGKRRATNVTGVGRETRDAA